jgi:Spy/CpxP family protein refolding chaperone
MRMLKVLVALATAVVLTGQTPVRPRVAAPAGQAQTALKTALDLGDQQISQLIQLRKDERQALQPIRQQMQETAKALRDAMAAGNPDPAAVGKLTLQARGLREQVRQSNKSYHERALALLDETQKTKLGNLQQALPGPAKTRAAIRAATALNLLDPPAPGPRSRASGQDEKQIEQGPLNC